VGEVEGGRGMLWRMIRFLGTWIIMIAFPSDWDGWPRWKNYL
jgi:hypothetical protein